MAPPLSYRKPPRGRTIGFQLEAPAELQLHDGPALVCCEQRAGRVVGEVEIAVFAAALIIDRDGILAERAREAIEREVTTAGGAVASPAQLPGASGFRADAVVRGALPYVYVFALAPTDLGVDGGLLIRVRAAALGWPAGEQLLRSLRIVTRQGVVAANPAASGAILPRAR